MPASHQPMAVAGVFYPPAAAACGSTVDEHLARAAPPECIAPKAVIAPHAGFAYSGPIQASAYASLRARRDEVARVVILAPAHRVAFKGLVLSPAEHWESPLGTLPVDWPHLARVLGIPGIAVNATPFQGEHAIEVQLPFVRRALGDVAICPVLVGDAAPDLVAAALRGLWGGPETVIVISSDLSHFHDDAGARQRDAAAAEAIELLKTDGLSSDLACGHRAVAGLLAEAQARDLRATTLDLRNSSRTAGRPERVVGYGAFAFEPAHGARLDPASRTTLLDLARRCIAIGLERKATPEVVVDRAAAPLLAARRATFVTLNLDRRLRGCIGSLRPHRTLANDVAANAFKAAFADPRFRPLSAEELARLEIHVSILSHARPLAAGSETELVRSLQPDVDGLIIRDGDRQAIFLPSVWSSIPDPLRFLRQLKRKAGLPSEHWSTGFRAWRFVTEAF